MEDICRLCCSTNFVNNDIFDEENALYVKMSLYLPIKVFKNDRLPQKVCDKCSCKVNDFYQFCNETIEVQNRLRALFLPSDTASVDLTLIKDNASPLPSIAPCEQSTQTDSDRVLSKMDIKQEPAPSPTLIKQEENIYESDHSLGNCSDNSDDMSLITLKKRKNTKKEVNGIDKKTKKKKPKLKDWEILMKALPEGTAISLVDKTNVPDVKEECKEEDATEFVMPIDMKKVKSEVNQVDTYHCCVCLAQCYSRNEMRQHYRLHKEPLSPATEPAPPPPPPGDHPLRCTRCRKEVTREGWTSHWQRHWQRDRRPYRCALCEKSFRDHHQILKHGLTHAAPGAVSGAVSGAVGVTAGVTAGGAVGGATPAAAAAAAAAAADAPKRFVCDFCPERFVYMRFLLEHRTRAHPEGASRPLALRCGTCARTFAHLNSLRRHLRSHSGERNYLCNVCGKALSSREHLKFHIRIHTGYKPNVCKTCGKGFVKKCNLTLHERVHSGEKPHVCSHCGKAFSQRSTLVIHERYHSGARPYECGLCGRGFVAKGLLSMHLKTTCI